MDEAKAAQAGSPGQIAIQNGQVVVRMPTPGSPRPSLTPGAHVILKVNGQQVTETVAIDENDEVTIEATPDPPFKEVWVEVDKDGSEAVAYISRRAGVNHAIKDAPFAPHVTVVVRVTEKLPPPTVTAEDVREALAKAGVVFGIDGEAIDQLVARSELESSAVVARSRPATEPIDGHVRPHSSTESDVGMQMFTGEELKVDLLDRGEIQSVQQGEVVGVWVDPAPGQDGQNVRGETIRARQPRAPRIKLGSGVSRSEGSPYIVAARTGRPVIMDTLVDVIPSYDVSGDVNVETGHVEFAGDVTVRGNVEESLRVRAGGSVTISGMIFRKARVEAGGSVTAKGVVGGEVEAGGNSGVYTPLIDAVRKLAPLYQRAVENLRLLGSKLESTGAKQPLGVFFKALLERHFPDVEKLAQEIGAILSQHESAIDDELRERLAGVVSLLSGRGPLRVASFDTLAPLTDLLESIPLELEARVVEADVKVGYLQNAEIASGGLVIVSGKACYNSTVMARKGFQAPNATVRGGVVTVTHGSVVAKEIGSPSSAATEISVPADGVIKAEMIFPNVRCVLGSRQYRFEMPRRRVELHLDRVTGEVRF